MKKIFGQILILAGAFLAVWLILSQVPFTEYFKVKALTKSMEDKLGNLVIDYIEKNGEQVKSDSTLSLLNRMKGRICRFNNIDSNSIRIYVFSNAEVNAFALPGKKLVLYSGIILDARNPEELASVMAHEIAHMERRHVIKKLTKEFGISMLMLLASGDAGTGIVKEMVKIISSTSFDREMEREADNAAVGYLLKARIDPQHFSDFLFRISHEKSDLPDQFEWVSTHPDTKERVATIIQLSKKHPVQPVQVLSNIDWHSLQRNIKQ